MAQPITVFHERPPDYIVDDFREHVRRTGQPHTWPLHSHTCPSPDSQPLALMTAPFELSVRYRARDRWAPCPICCPDHPKYLRGWLFWFPDEGVIRAIGMECGHRFFDNEAFAEAIANEQRRRARIDAENIIFENFIRMDDLKKAVLDLRPTARAVDALSRTLRQALGAKVAREIVRLVDATGGLEVTVTKYVDQGEGAKPVSFSETYGPLHGVGILKPRKHSCEALVALADQYLAQLDWADEAEAVEWIEKAAHEELEEAVISIREVERLVGEMKSRLIEAAAFVEDANLDRLASWGRDDRALAKVCAARHVHKGVVSFGFLSKQRRVVIPNILLESVSNDGDYTGRD